WVICARKGPEAPKLRIASWPVCCLNKAAICFAGSVKLAATATLVWPASAGAANIVRTAPKAAASAVIFTMTNHPQALIPPLLTTVAGGYRRRAVVSRDTNRKRLDRNLQNW